jgi:hypothetical protein
MLQTSAIPELAFAVEHAEALEYVAVPTLRFRLRIAGADGQPIRSILLDVQIQIAARRRAYPDGGDDRLLELFGPPAAWGTTLRTLPWTRTTLVVPPFASSTTVDLDVPCSYDLEITASRYFAALDDGDAPLEFLFSGSVFYANPDGLLQTARIAWTKEAEYALPVRIWREAMDRHFPGSAWVRLGRDSFERLHAYRSRNALPSWDEAVDALLGDEERR